MAVVVHVALAEPGKECNFVDDSILHIILAAYTTFGAISTNFIFANIMKRILV